MVRGIYGGLSFRVKQGGKKRGNRYSPGGGQASTLKKIGSRNQGPLWQGDKNDP